MTLVPSDIPAHELVERWKEEFGSHRMEGMMEIIASEEDLHRALLAREGVPPEDFLLVSGSRRHRAVVAGLCGMPLQREPLAEGRFVVPAGVEVVMDMWAPADFGPVLMHRRTLSPPAPLPEVVYVLSAHDYGDHSIVGAFSSEEFAIAKARELAFTKGGRRRRENYDYWIDECAVNGESLRDWQVAL